ncbi:MAG: ATP-binding protein [Planctomycetota bacterium]
MLLRLSIIEGPDAGKSFALPMDEPQLIGRSSEALPITDTTVSRRHAEMTPDGGVWFVRDLQSQNNTYVNGRRIIGRTEVNEGDEIRVGATVIRVGDAESSRSHLVELMDEGALDTDIERTLRSEDPGSRQWFDGGDDGGDDDDDSENALADSVALAEPEPSRAAQDHLRIIYEVTRLTTRLTDKQRLLEAVMGLVFDEFEPERGLIMLVPKDAPTRADRLRPQEIDPENIPATGDIPLVGGLAGGVELEPAVVRYAHPPTTESDEDDKKIQISRTILNLVVKEAEGVLSSNAQSDPRFRSGDSVTRYNIRSAVCSPIRFGDRVFGAIYIDSSIANYTYTEQQLKLLNAVGQHTALALANSEQTAKQLHAERLAAIGETVAGLSHSIKNILQGLRGGADVVEMGLEKNDLKLAKGGWDIQKRNIDRIVGLTMNMLTFSRQRHVDITLTKLNSLIEECAQLLEKQASEKGCAIIVDADPEMPPVPIDPDLMHQALMNLMTNAIDAVPGKAGIVTVRAFYLEPGPDRPKLDGPTIELIVADNGPGIPKGQLNRIFEPFHTTKGLKGTGLGLAVTRRIVNDHQGRIRVETAEGKGTVMRILMPGDLGKALDPSATTETGGRGSREIDALDEV